MQNHPTVGKLTHAFYQLKLTDCVVGLHLLLLKLKKVAWTTTWLCRHCNSS